MAFQSFLKTCELPRLFAYITFNWHLVFARFPVFAIALLFLRLPSTFAIS